MKAGGGYTFHQHYDKLGLINMNRPKGAHDNTAKINHRVGVTFGRVYDPIVGRFLSIDPLVGNPLSAQDYNGYSYCANNPLKYTDPDGYQKYAMPMPVIEFSLSNGFTRNGAGGGGTSYGGLGYSNNGSGLNGYYYDWITSEYRTTSGDVASFVEVSGAISNYVINTDRVFQGKATDNGDNSFTSNPNGLTSVYLLIADNNPVMGKARGLPTGQPKATGGLDWGGIVNASLGALGGGAEIIIGGSAEAVTYGLSTPLLIDGWVRVGTNVTRLGFYFAGKSNVGGAIPGNAGAIVGKGIDMSTGKSFYDYGYGQALLGTTNDFVSFLATGGTASSMGNFVENPSTYRAIDYGVAYLGYNNSMYNNLYPLLPKK